jgi:hypothetical protein
MGASTGASNAAVELTTETADWSAGVQLTMSWATVVAEQPAIGMVPETRTAQSMRAPSFAGELVVWPGLGSFARRPRRAVPRALIRVMTVPVPAVPKVTPCCERTPATVIAAMSRPAAEVRGWIQMFEIRFIRLLLQDVLSGPRRRVWISIGERKSTDALGRPRARAAEEKAFFSGTGRHHGKGRWVESFLLKSREMRGNSMQSRRTAEDA